MVPNSWGIESSHTDCTVRVVTAIRGRRLGEVNRIEVINGITLLLRDSFLNILK